MRLATVLFLSIVVLPVAYGQDAAKDNSSRTDAPVQKVLEKLDDLRPPAWTYSDLASKSDLIVIAKAESRSEIDWANDIGGDFGRETTKLLSNTLRVLSILKGQSSDEIEVVTLEWKPDVIVLTNSDFATLRTQHVLPSLVSIETDGRVTGYGGAQPLEMYKIEPEYLLYLRKVNGDRFVPVTGQRYSGLSVRMLNN